MMPWILILLSIYSSVLYGSVVQESVVQVTVFSQAPDFDAPWRPSKIKSSDYLGIIVQPDRVLVPASAVAYQTMIEWNKVGDSIRYPLEIDKIDLNANLALLKPRTEGGLQGFKPYRLGQDLEIDGQAVLLSGRLKHSLARTLLRLKEVSIKKALTSSYSYSHYLFEGAQSKGFGWSEPIIDKKDLLVGMSVGQDSKAIYAIPAKIIRHFLADAAGSSYKGFPWLGLDARPLNSTRLQKYFGLKRGQRGVLVTKVHKGSPFDGLVKPYDVLTAIGKAPIDHNGYYPHTKWGALMFTDLLSEYYPGDDISLSLIRKGQPLKVSAKAKAYNQDAFVMPGFPFDGVDHLIFGGFLFQQLDLGFLKSWGKNWLGKAPDDMVYLYHFENQSDLQNRKRVIFLNRVLPDTHNKGYHSLTNLVLQSVNGREIHSLDDLKHALGKPENPRDPLARFVFANGGGEIILDYKGLLASHHRIAKSFHIQSKESFFWQ